MPTRPKPIKSLANHCGFELGNPIVFLSLEHHGLGLAHHAAEGIPNAVTGVISLAHHENSRPEARLHLVRAPALSEAKVLLFAPVIATGLSTSVALSLLRHSGASDIALLSLVIGSTALARIQSDYRKVRIWTAAVDSDWDSKVGPLPGIGNFAERLYG